MDYENEDGVFYIAMITCAHNLFRHRAHPLVKAKFYFGQHGDQDTIQWEAKILTDMVIIPEEYKDYACNYYYYLCLKIYSLGSGDALGRRYCPFEDRGGREQS